MRTVTIPATSTQISITHHAEPPVVAVHSAPFLNTPAGRDPVWLGSVRIDGIEISGTVEVVVDTLRRAADVLAAALDEQKQALGALSVAADAPADRSLTPCEEAS